MLCFVVHLVIIFHWLSTLLSDYYFLSDIVFYTSIQNFLNHFSFSRDFLFFIYLMNIFCFYIIEDRDNNFLKYLSVSLSMWLISSSDFFIFFSLRNTFYIVGCSYIRWFGIVSWALQLWLLNCIAFGLYLMVSVSFAHQEISLPVLQLQILVSQMAVSVSIQILPL